MTTRKKSKSTAYSMNFRRFGRRGFLVLILGALVYGAIDLARYAHDADLFLLREIRIEGNFLISDHEILEALEIPSRIRLWRVMPSQMEAQLLDLPLVESARVQRILPETLVIDISERNPIADWKDPRTGEVYAIDEKGMVLCKAAGIQRRISELGKDGVFLENRPLVRGLKIEGLMVGDLLDREGLNRLLPAFGLAVAREEPWVRDVRFLTWKGNEMGWVLECTATAQEMRLGMRNFVERIGNIKTTWEFLRREKVVVAYIDFRFEEQGILIRPLNVDGRKWMEIATRYPRPEGKSFGPV